MNYLSTLIPLLKLRQKALAFGVMLLFVTAMAVYYFASDDEVAPFAKLPKTFWNIISEEDKDRFILNIMRYHYLHNLSCSGVFVTIYKRKHYYYFYVTCHTKDSGQPEVAFPSQNRTEIPLLLHGAVTAPAPLL